MNRLTGMHFQASHIIRKRIIPKIIIITKQKKKGGILTDASFLLVEKRIQCYTERGLSRKCGKLRKHSLIFCQYTRTCAACNSGRMERKT